MLNRHMQRPKPTLRGPRPIAWLLALAALTAAGGSPAAEPDKPRVFKDWRIQCEKPEGSAEHCHMFQGRVLKEDGKRLLHIAVGYSPTQDDQVIAILTLPLGISLPPGVSLQVDDGEPLTLEVEHCIPQGCRVLLQLDDKLLGAMKAGNQATVTFRDVSRQPVGVPVSLSGFTAALKALK